jgi:lipopolysaccharide/colanic/teichoic acid biosynthesis glycosyltransferase
MADQAGFGTHKRCQLFFKSMLDKVFAFLLLVILSPVMIIVALLIRLFQGSPVFFKQTRPGYQEKPFPLLKFRTMKDIYNDHGNLLPDEDRLTRVGKGLRALSLDELPQFINILKGEMSLVGPRPLLMEYLPLYSEEQRKRHRVKPGITGWAQVNGRNTLSWEEKFQLDVWYVDHWSLALDFKILGLTLIKALKREGISQEGSATMEKFRGSKE